ncbi:hypothetical protein [Candidatus Nitrososphaera sp. FF02]|uniref:hypothetical protein n=1 Tax=Candidatus Nitrososphaera sp. FF02 TaxID=3398226 RepID=UPI0039EAE266
MSTAVAQDFCKEILALDRGIRFAGIADMMAEVVYSKYRSGIIPLLGEKEVKIAILQSAIRVGTRGNHEPKLGETVYSFTLYRKVKRATIPIRKGDRITHMLMVSFDVEVDHEPLIVKKIIPLMERLVL